MKRIATPIAIALAVALSAPAFAGEENLFEPPKPMPDNFTIYVERTVQEQRQNRIGDGHYHERSPILEKAQSGGTHADVRQNGNNHRLRIRQSSTNSALVVVQSGNGAVADVEQTGDGKIGFLFQFKR